jgi:hypothetical protein
MKVASYAGNPTEATPFETVDIGISKSREGQLMILNVLSNTLYTDKISAVWREYGCNAADANVEAGKPDLPIKIVLPTNISPTAIIRDYGYGMTRDQVLNTFCYLGESTKRNSNEVTGMLGIGSKAGFAYGDSFLVVSYTKGTKVVYNCYRDQGVPKMAVMHTEQSDESDGVEIKIPVRREDIQTFVDRAERVFRYFRVHPDVKGGQIDWKLTEPKFKGSSWAFVGGGSETSVAIMGNVGYRIDTHSLNLTDKWLSTLQAGVELNFKIGELEVTANREGLQYKDRTISAIKAKLQTLANELGATVTQTIAAAPSFWHAKAAYGAAFESGGAQTYGRVGISSLISDKVLWKNIPIKTGRVDIQNDLGKDATPDPEIGVTLYSKTYWRRRVQKANSADEIYANNKQLLVINDLPKKGPSPARVREYFNTHADTQAMAVFTFQTDAAKARYWKAKNLEGAPTLLLSTLPKPAPIVRVGGSSAPHNSKYSAKAFVLDEKYTSPRSYGSEKKSDWFTQETVDKNKGGVFIILKNFWIHNGFVGGYSASPSNLIYEIKSWRAAGLLTTPVYGFKEDRVAKLGPKWVKLEVYLQSKLDAVMNEPDSPLALANYFAASAYDGFLQPKIKAAIPSASEAASLIATKQDAQSVKHGKVFAALYTHQNSRFLKVPAIIKPTLDFPALEKNVKARYPLLNIMPRHQVIMDAAMHIAGIAQYINLIEQDFAGRTGTKKGN